MGTMSKFISFQTFLGVLWRTWFLFFVAGASKGFDRKEAKDVGIGTKFLGTWFLGLGNGSWEFLRVGNERFSVGLSAKVPAKLGANKRKPSTNALISRTGSSSTSDSNSSKMACGCTPLAKHPQL